MNAKQIAERLRTIARKAMDDFDDQQDSDEPDFEEMYALEQDWRALKAAADLLERMAWVPVSERLPDLNAPVVLINIEHHWNAVFECGVTATGYLSDFGEMHWSLFGEYGATLQSYTHWRYLDPPSE